MKLERLHNDVAFYVSIGQISLANAFMLAAHCPVDLQSSIVFQAKTLDAQELKQAIDRAMTQRASTLRESTPLHPTIAHYVALGEIHYSNVIVLQNYSHTIQALFIEAAKKETSEKLKQLIEEEIQRRRTIEALL